MIVTIQTCVYSFLEEVTNSLADPMFPDRFQKGLDNNQ